MNSPNDPTSDEKISASIESVTPGFNTVLRINRTVRGLIFDYTLAAAILGLLMTSMDNWLSPKLLDGLDLLALGLLELKMIREIGTCWGQPKGQDIYAIVSSVFGVFGAFAIAIVVQLIVGTLGLFIPVIIVWTSAVGHATLTWALGRVVNQFYLSTKKVRVSTLERVIKNNKI